MNKLKALDYINKKSKEGYITHKMILDIYKDSEEIPENVLDLVCHAPYEPKPYQIYCGSVLARELKEMFKESLELE